MFWIKLKKRLGLIRTQKYEDIILIDKIEKSGLFDSEWYLKYNPDVCVAKVHPVKHYLDHGWREGRNPSPRFNNNAYLSDYPDVASAGICPLLHYINHGEAEGRLVHELPNTNFINSIFVYKVLKKSKLFNKKWYLKTYPDVKKAKINPIKHYILHGAFEGRNPSKHFNTTHYLNSNPDVKKAEMNPLYHYIKFGINEGRVAKTLDGKNTKTSTTLKQKIKLLTDEKKTSDTDKEKKK
jgi:hypothetical protein